jgi:hypothetical protein
MIELNRFETHGRKLMVEFRCYRCKITEIRPLEDCTKEVTEGYRDLYDLRPPKGWKDGGFYYPMFCPDCKKAYEDFMKGGEG